VATRRSLRPDPNLNCIIQKLFPDLAEYEAEQEAELARVDTELTRVRARTRMQTRRRQWIEPIVSWRAHLTAARSLGARKPRRERAAASAAALPSLGRASSRASSARRAHTRPRLPFAYAPALHLVRAPVARQKVAQEREEQMKVQGAELRARAIEQETDARRVRKAADKDAAHARASSAVALSTTEKAQRARRDALAAADAQASRSLSRLGKSHKKSAGLGALGKRPLQPAAESLQAVRGVDRAAAWRKKKRLEKAGLPPDVAEGDSTIVFAFTRHPDEHHVAKLEREVLQTSRKLQVHHLLKFLVLKLKLKESAWTSFCLSLRQTPSVLDMVPAPSSLMLDSTLDAIVCSHLSDPSQLVLEYRLKQGVTLQDVRKELSAADGSAGPSAAGAAGP
jgi:hypothetical protein